MKIIIAGAGEVGYHLAKLLSFESHDITLIDCSQEHLDYANVRLDIKTVKGNAISITTLKDCRISGADLVIGVTESETTNITICVLAKQMGAEKTIARISNPEFLENRVEIGFKKFGIDELISPATLAVEELKLLLDDSAFNDSFEFEEGALKMVGLGLSKNAPFVGKTIQESATIFPELHFMPIAIERAETQDVLIPRGDTVFQEGDQAYFVTVKDGVEELYKLIGKKKKAIKNVMILGGSNIGYRTAGELCEENFKIKLVESDRKKALEMADELPNVLVVQGDGRSAELLEEESIDKMDAFIAVTEDSETNFMSCLLAKSKGVAKTIALVENIDYFQLGQNIGIDTLINKKLLAADNIFRYIRKGDVVAITKLNHMNAELLEFKVKDSSKACNKKIVELELPRSAIIGGVIRKEEGTIALGNFMIKAGDRVVICCLASAIPKVEKLFK